MIFVEVSVIMPVYNNEKYRTESIEPVKNKHTTFVNE